MTYLTNNRLLKHAARTGGALVIGAVLLLSPASPVPTPQAHAGWPVSVIGDVPRLIEKQLDAVGWMAAKAVVQSLTQSVVRWINSGFEGSPAFESDLNRNLGRLADTVAEDFIRGLDSVIVSNTGISIRAPFQDQISAALRREFYRTTSSYGFDARHPYQDCYGTRGRTLDGWFCETQNPANNAIGRYQLARDEMWATINNETQNRLQELDWGKGFLSWRGPCGKYARPSSSDKTTASAKGDAGAKSPAGGGSGTSATTGVKDTGSKVSLQQTDNTVGCSIKTPGAIIEETLGMSVNSPLRQLEIADSINEIVGALMTQMVSQVLGGGGLGGLSQPSSGGGASYLDRATTSLSGGFLQSVTKAQSDITSYQAGWRKIADAATAASRTCSGSKSAQANTVLAQANARAAEAGTMLAKLNEIGQSATTLQSGGGSSGAVTFLISEYESVLRGMGPVAEGEAESQDSGNAEPPSLYTQMVRLTASCVI